MLPNDEERDKNGDKSGWSSASESSTPLSREYFVAV